MKTETNREVAERTIREWVEHGLDEHYEQGAEFTITMPPDDLIERFEAALKARDERAAKIAETHERTHGNMHFGYCGPAIAAAIRGIDEN